MSTTDQMRHAADLLGSGESDEGAQRLAGVSLLDVLSLRADRASAPAPALREAGARIPRPRED